MNELYNSIDIIFNGYKQYIITNNLKYKNAFLYWRKLLSNNNLKIYDIVKKYQESLEKPIHFNSSYKDLVYALRDDEDFLKYVHCVIDRFGFFEKNKLHPYPEYNETSIFKETSNRIKTLGYKNILWSGGIDSTYIICAYFKEKIPCTVICDNSSVNYNKEFYTWMIKHNIPVLILDNITNSYTIKNMLTGYVADTLFSITIDRHFVYNQNKSFYDNLEGLINRDIIYEKLIEYGNFLQKPTTTNEDFLKLINYGMLFTHHSNEIRYIIFPQNDITAFFNTKQFSDISWTQYWHKDYKYEAKTFICDITENDYYMKLQKNNCSMKYRKQLNIDNYTIPPNYLYK